MAQAVSDTVSAQIDADNYNFRANGQTLKFKGFMALYVESKDQEEQEEDGKIPELEEGEKLKKEKI